MVCGGAFKPLVVSNELVEEETEEKMNQRTKELGKVGGGQLMAKVSLALQRYMGLQKMEVSRRWE